MTEYMREHGDEYVHLDLPGSLELLVHRDRANWRYLQARGYSRAE